MRHSHRTAAFGFAALLTVCFGLVQAAEAGTIVVARDTSKYSGGNSAGEYGVTSFSGASIIALGSGVGVSGDVFQTFCIEQNESVALNTTLNFTVDTAAVAGGNSGQDTTVGGQNADSLDARTAYLFHQFWTGALSGYNYTQGSGRTASATSLQLAIWQLEGENTSSALISAFNGDSQAQSWVTAANNAVSGGSWSGLGNVRVINLTVPGSNANQQSMLVEVTPVPLPSAVWLGLGLLAGLSGVGLVRQRRHQAFA